MRLQLSIRRHALPITNIIWTVRGQDSTSTAPHSSATISQLLEDVNDIVTLESEDWGLEDYAVEVNGYECLHFQPIESVLKEDDQVTIRPLLTNDLRTRRLGGRHQISTDGKHLYDGVAFGRPYLRKTARPPFRIPSRKRRRLDSGQGEYVENGPMVLYEAPERESPSQKALFANEGEISFNTATGEISQLGLGEKIEVTGQDLSDDENDTDFDGDVESSSDDAEDLQNLEISDELKALLEDTSVSLPPAFKGDDQARLSANSSDAVRGKKRKLQQGNDESMATSDSLQSQAYASYRQEKFGQAFGSKSTNQLGRVEPSDNTSGIKSSSPRSQSGSSSTASAPDSVTSSDPSPSDSSSSGTDSESEFDSEPDSEAEGRAEAESTSSSGSEDASTSDSTTASSRRKQVSNDGLGTIQAQEAKVLGTSCSGAAIPKTVAPGQGSLRTHKQNARNKKRKVLARLKAEGLLPVDASFSDLLAYEAAQSKTHNAHGVSQESEIAEAIAARKKQVLQQLPPAKADNTNRSRLPSNALDQVADIIDDQGDEGAKPMSRSRAKLDLDSSRRMVFGSLGLKTPKTPAAEQALREKLAKNFSSPIDRAGKLARARQGGAFEADGRYSADESRTHSWKEKIDLHAVECEIEDRILSQPPFPFVQHWETSRSDDRQQSPAKEHIRRQPWEPKPTDDAVESPQHRGHQVDGDVDLDEAQLSVAIQSQLMQEARELSARGDNDVCEALDMPLITSLEYLEALKSEDVVTGSVVAFKQLEVSKDTNWQPQVSAYRTAKVEEVLGDGMIRILLAERDRDMVSQSLDQTGERVFEKFEMPFEESQDDMDTGVRDVLYEDLVEPKLVRGARLDTSINNSAGEVRGSEHVLQLNTSNPQVEESNDAALEEIGAEVEVELSTPRRKEISEIIRDAGFDSTLDAGLLEPSPPAFVTGMANDGGDSSPSLQVSGKSSRLQAMNLDGANTESYTTHLHSPHYTPWDSSLDNQEMEVSDTFSAVGLEGRSYGSDPGLTVFETEIRSDAVVYPRISQLALDESTTLVEDGTITPPEAQVHSSSSAFDRNAAEAARESNEGRHEVANSDYDHNSRNYNSKENGNDNASERVESSYLESLKSTIPPSNDVETWKSSNKNEVDDDDNDACYPRLTFSDGSRIATPIYDSSEDSGLPSLSEITSTAQSRKMSPPPLKTTGRRSTEEVQKKEEAMEGKRKTKVLEKTKPISSRASAAATKESMAQSSEAHSRQPSSSWAASSQIPAGSQFVDLTLSSDFISPSSSSPPPQLGDAGSGYDYIGGLDGGKQRSSRGGTATTATRTAMSTIRQNNSHSQVKTSGSSSSSRAGASLMADAKLEKGVGGGGGRRGLARRSGKV